MQNLLIAMARKELEIEGLESKTIGTTGGEKDYTFRIKKASSIKTLITQ